MNRATEMGGPNVNHGRQLRGIPWLGSLILAVVILAGGVTRQATAQSQESEGRNKDSKTESAPSSGAADENAGRGGETPGQPAAQEPAPRTGIVAGRAPRSADRVNDLISQLDPAVLNRLLGAEITVEFIGGQVILKGPEEAVKTLELLIRALDREVPTKVVEVVTVNERDAKEIARTVQESLRDVFKTPNQREEELVTITALTSTILLVSATEDQIQVVIDIIRQVDAVPDPLGKVELMRFEVRHRKASDVARELTKVLEQFQKAAGLSKDKSKLQIIPNNANNTITVTAREAERVKIQSLIDEIDVEPKAGWGEQRLTVFPLIHSKATDLAKVIQDLLVSPPKTDQQAVEEFLFRLLISKASTTGEITDLPPIDLQKPIKIIPDDGTNSLIVATAEENVVPVGELIRLLDGVPVGESVAVRLFPLRFADAETVGETIKGMFEEGKKLPEDPDGSGQGAVPEGEDGRALVYNLGIATDVRTNTLVVSGRPGQLDLVSSIVNQLDRPATALKFPLRLLFLEYADATRVGQIMQELFDKRIEAAEKTEAGKVALERERVFLTVDVRGNALIVSASEENYAEIETIARQLDTRPARLFDQIRLIPCQRLAAGDIKTKIEELWKRKAELRRQQEFIEDLPVVVADERSNALVIASSLEDFEEIKRLVEVLETQPMIEDTRLFKLEFADAAVLTDMLNKLFDGLAANSESFKKPTLLPDLRSNAVVVAATRDSMDRTADLIRRLDVPGGPNTAIINVYPLRFASSNKLAPRMQKLFDSRSEGEEVSRTPVLVLPDETSNSLVCSASRDDHQVIEEIVALLDRPSSIARQFEIFPLRLARAARVAERLESLFTTQAEGGTGSAAAIATEADERTNSIIVWASPSEMANIAEVIARLDTAVPAVEMMVRVIQLKQALAEDFASVLQETLVGEQSGSDDERAVIMSFIEKAPDGGEVVRRLLKQDIKVQPDPRTNSLMVVAPADSMAMLEAMIRDFDRIRPIRSEIRLFPLINSDAQTMVDKLKELFEPGEAAEGETARRFNFGDLISEDELASVGQELRFTADTRTNTIIAAGAEVDLRMVEDLIRFLDSQEAEDRVVEVYQAKFRDAQDLASAVRNFVEQEQTVLGEGEDEESKLRRRERQVSVEALGQEDEGSSNLIVGTSARGYQRTMDMIQQLDRPEPQVMISVLIAEVTLSNDVELGIEIAGQDLDFSANAVVGPNGIIQGSDFDWVTGTDVGGAGQGLGGFNFTITGEDFSFLVHALQTDSRLEVLSRPVLMVRNGEEGKITIADEVPIVESSRLNDTGQTQSTIGRQDVGIVLTTTPHISPDGYVTVEITQEISNISGENIQLTEGVSSPVFSKREVDTNVTVRDGETVVIGGLIQSRESEGENKVPLLGDLPWIGPLFRFNRVTNAKTELLVVLTVDVLRTDEDVRRISIEQRDKFVLPDNIRRSPLMEKLRILPDEAAMGPVQGGTRPDSTDHKPEPHPVEPPKPSKIYGPVISHPKATTTTERPVYGPTVARGVLLEDE